MREAMRQTDRTKAGTGRMLDADLAGNASRPHAVFGRPAAHNGLELSCPAEAGKLPRLSRMPAGKAQRPIRQPAGSASASCWAHSGIGIMLGALAWNLAADRLEKVGLARKAQGDDEAGMRPEGVEEPV